MGLLHNDAHKSPIAQNKYYTHFFSDKTIFFCIFAILNFDAKMKRKTNKEAETEMLAKVVAQAMSDKKGTDITMLDLREVGGAPTSFFVICTGNSPLHTSAISDSIQETVKKTFNINPSSTEGYDSAEWILMDYFDVVAHVFVQKTRDFYGLEELWADGKRTEIK